jgi:hypothetical protein
MAKSARLAVLAAVLAGCTGPGLDKAGGPQAGQPIVLTLANFAGRSGELDGFADNVQRLSGGTMRIDIEYDGRSEHRERADRGCQGGEGGAGRPGQPGLGLRRGQQLRGA